MSLNKITLYVSSTRGSKTNTSYPFPIEVTCIEDMKKAAAFDHVCGKHADGKNTKGRMIIAYRSEKTFRESDCMPQDCDNTEKNPLLPDLPADKWKTPADVRAAFPGVAFYVVYSRNNMKAKNGLPARPKFHVYFVMRKCTNAKEYQKLKQQVQQYFPAFDIEALGAARFLFGVENPVVEYYDGDLTINEFMERRNALPEIIAEGERNSTISAYAARVFKKYGDTDTVVEMIHCANDSHCQPPLENDEVETIIRSARAFFHNTIEKAPDYISPDEYAAMDFAEDGKKIPVTSKEVKQILEKLHITVRLNVISGMVEIEGMPPQHSKSNAANVLPVLIMDYITKHNMKCSKQTLDDCLVLIEDENRFNPVEEMLLSQKWDGTDRLNELSQILGIDGNETECRYLSKWCHQSVALALNDDIEPAGADGVLVIQSEQGAGKTLFCATIAIKSDWFAEGISIDLTNKDSVIQATNCWIAELGELDSTLKREQSALKAFLTSKTDTYRQPYARVQTKKPRRTSFCATVNPQEFLNDETGSRRYWVVKPKQIDVERLKALSQEWLMQLWVQVYEQFYLKNPQGFRLTAEEREQLQRDNAQYSKPLPGEIELYDSLEWNYPVSKWNWYRTTTIKQALNLPVTAAQLGKVLTKLASNDSRIQMKAPKNQKQYLLPPMRTSVYSYKAVSDFQPVLSDEPIEPLTA